MIAGNQDIGRTLMVLTAGKPPSAFGGIATATKNNRRLAASSHLRAGKPLIPRLKFVRANLQMFGHEKHIGPARFVYQLRARGADGGLADRAARPPSKTATAL